MNHEAYSQTTPMMSGFPPTNGTGPRMTGSLEFAEFARRFRLIQEHRDSSDELIRDVIAYSEHIASTLSEENAKLRERLEHTELDLTAEVANRRGLQQQVHSLEKEMKSMLEVHDTLKKQNPYIAVLIDGDGLLFKEAWIRQGVEGGRKAASLLRSFILGLCGSRSEGIEIIAQIYLNLGDLGRVMRNAGVIEKEQDLLDFAKGFSKHAHFNFVDIGQGKEEADEKLREMTKWHLKNHNCKQILLGCSHDSGYAPYLHNILRDEETKRRISILEGFSTHRLLVETGINIINYPELFRSDKLVETSFGNGGFQQRPPASNDFHNGFQQKSVSNGDIGLQPLPAPSVASPTVGQSPAPAPAPAPSMTPVPVPVAAPAVSYAARVVKSASPPPKMTLPLAPKPKATPQADQKPAWNPGPRGFDAPIKVSEKVMNEIKKRKDNNKLCNNHYLRGPCAKGPDCCFEHKYKPSPEEINAIAMLARLNPCTNGQDCDVDNCIYGHHCPSVVKGQCQHPYCKFEEQDHPPGTTYRKAPKGYDNY